MTVDMIDSGEKLLPLVQLARVSAARRSASQLRRWIRDGLNNRSGKRVFLEHVRIGRNIASSLEAIRRFLSALQA
jgi:hypothetical protein